jgi:hypothetical protein
VRGCPDKHRLGNDIFFWRKITVRPPISIINKKKYKVFLQSELTDKKKKEKRKEDKTCHMRSESSTK